MCSLHAPFATLKPTRYRMVVLTSWDRGMSNCTSTLLLSLFPLPLHLWFLNAFVKNPGKIDFNAREIRKVALLVT